MRSRLGLLPQLTQSFVIFLLLRHERSRGRQRHQPRRPLRKYAYASLRFMYLGSYNEIVLLKDKVKLALILPFLIFGAYLGQ